MSTTAPELISADNLSFGWGRAFLKVFDRGKNASAPLLISICGFNGSVPAENARIRHGLDAFLAKQSKFSSDVTASLIFPYKFWTRSGCLPPNDFFAKYLTQLLPRLQRRDPRNRNGTYFQRMISFEGVLPGNGKRETATKNQLEHILYIWDRDRAKSRRPRHSALQVACLDPVKDHTGQPVRGFPCLQQLSFSYDDSGGMAVNAFYPTQYLFDRGYGNYLGLCHLGHFMAQAMGLTLVRLNCLVTCPELGGARKSSLADLAKLIREIIPN